MKLSNLICYITASACAVHGSKYPAEYPFENESQAPPTPRAETPNFKYTEEDETGGYIYTYAFMRTDIETFPFAFHFNSAFNAFVAVKFNDQEVPGEGEFPFRDVSVYNCTDKGTDFIISEETFPGVFKNEQVCEKGECCKQWYGSSGFWGGATPDDFMLTRTEGEYDSGTCADGISEPMYCIAMEYWAHAGCIETFISPSERLNNRVVPCYDTQVNFFLGCPVYRVAGIVYDGRDPASYNAASTPAENTAHTSFWLSQDKVCRPYSYYFPEFAKATPGEESTMSESSAVSEESGTQTLQIIMAVLVSLAAF